MTHFLEKIQDPWKDATATTVPGAIHALDPRVRIVTATVFAFFVVAAHGFTTLGLALLTAVLLAWAARLPPAQTLRRVLTVDTFIVFLLLMLPFTTPGEPLFTLWGLSGSLQGVMRALEIALKANAVILALLALAGTIEVTQLGHALARLKLPEKFIHLLLFTIRYIEVMNREYRRLRLAMRARAFQAGSNRHTWRSIGYLLGMLLVRSLERSERVLAAMKCRGFDGRLYLVDHLTWSRRDTRFAGLAVLVLGLLIGIELA